MVFLELGAIGGVVSTVTDARLQFILDYTSIYRYHYKNSQACKIVGAQIGNGHLITKKTISRGSHVCMVAES
jgi:hypothetical protein